MISKLANFLFPAVIALFLYLGFVAGKDYIPPFPQAGQMHSFSDSALSDAGVLSLGIRRLAADIWFIRLMQYYGTQQCLDEEKKEDSHRSVVQGYHHHHDYGDRDAGTGKYPDIFPRSRHILDLDPYFTHAGLYSAGALAFNLGRSDEAIELIEQAKRYEPREWKYSAYLAAIGYRLAGNPGKVADILAPVVRDPECPTMIKQLVAFLNKKIKRYRAAAEIYADIAMTARDPYYVRNSRQELAKLEKILRSADRR